jgi:prepilin-type N-terminal cleavage/methylation domain-containing protein
MFLNMEFKTSNHNRARRGFTLVEMVVAVAIGCLLLAALATLYVFCMRSFASMANYSDLNNKSRYASDIVSRDIRCCNNVISASANQLVLNEPDDTTGNTTYTYDDVVGTLSRTKNGETKVLLSGIVSGSPIFTLYQRPSVGAPYEQFPTAASPSVAKLVAFQWSCSRSLVNSQNSESVEGAIVELRNQ